jgi:hypothetical protein
VESNSKRFLWGVVLVWAPWIPILIGFGYAFHDALHAKATGLFAIAGSYAAFFTVYGVVATLTAQIAAILLLSRNFAPGRSMRNFFSILSICFSVLMVIMIVLFLWLSWSWGHHAG